nr:uncharacterized protein LOC128701399 [Cherax quadricarinatus]
MDSLTEEERMLSWIYEYSIKHEYNYLCSKIEKVFKTRNKEPYLPVSRYMNSIRQHSQLVKFRVSHVKDKDYLKKLVDVLEGFVQFEPLHRDDMQHELTVRLYMTAKLLYLNSEHFDGDIVLEYLPDFIWKAFQRRFNYQDDCFRLLHFTFAESAESIINTLHEQGTFPLQLDEDFTQELELSLQFLLPDLHQIFRQYFPITELEKIMRKEKVGLDFCGIQDSLVKRTETDFSEILKTVMEKIKLKTQINGEAGKLQNDESETFENIDVEAMFADAGGECQLDDIVDVVEFKGKYWNVKRDFAYLHSTLKVGEPRDGNQFLVNTSQDNALGPELNTEEAVAPIKGLEVIIHRGKVYEIIADVGPQITSRPYLPEQKLTLTIVQVPVPERGTNNLSHDELNICIKHLESLLECLKEKIFQFKENIDGCQKFKDKDNKSGQSHLAVWNSNQLKMVRDAFQDVVSHGSDQSHYLNLSDDDSDEVTYDNTDTSKRKTVCSQSENKKNCAKEKQKTLRVTKD